MNESKKLLDEVPAENAPSLGDERLVIFELTEKDALHLAEHMAHDAKAREIAELKPSYKTGTEYLHNKVMTDIRTELQTIRATEYLKSDTPAVDAKGLQFGEGEYYANCLASVARLNDSQLDDMYARIFEPRISPQPAQELTREQSPDWGPGT